MLGIGWLFWKNTPSERKSLARARVSPCTHTLWCEDTFQAQGTLDVER